MIFLTFPEFKHDGKIYAPKDKNLENEIKELYAKGKDISKTLHIN